MSDHKRSDGMVSIDPQELLRLAGIRDEVETSCTDEAKEIFRQICGNSRFKSERCQEVLIFTSPYRKERDDGINDII